MTGLPVSATIPGQTLVGNPSTQPGPQQAIPYATLSAFVTATLSDVSTSSLTIGTGQQTIQGSPAKNFAPGQFLVVSNSAANFMSGIVVSYNATTGVLVLNVLSTSGSGTFSSWNIGLSGPQGAQGSTPNLRSFLAGFTLSNDGTLPNTVLDVAAGQAADSTNAVLINGGAFTKSIGGSWVAGTGQNGMGVGLTATASTWYHVFGIINNTQYDVYFDTSITGANAPAGTTALRYLGSIKLDGSVHILPFFQIGDYFGWKASDLDVNGVAASATAASKALTVPPGINVQARVVASYAAAAGGHQLWVYSPLMNDEATATTEAVVSTSSANTPAAQIDVWTDTSQNVRVVADSATGTYSLRTLGYLNTRGRLN